MPGKGLTYGRFVGATMDCIQADMSRVIWGSLTPIEEVIAPRIGTLPADIAAQLRREFHRQHVACSDNTAADRLRGEVETFHAEKLHIAFDEHEIRSHAARWSELCGKMQSLEVMQDFAASVAVAAPEVRGDTTRDSAANRLKCVMWWRRSIRREYTMRAESHMISCSFVHKRRQVYASDRCVQVKAERTARNTSTLQALVAVSSEGDQLDMWDVVQKSEANPVLRRNGLMSRIGGFEEIAKGEGHRCRFFTLTAPSAFHRMHENGSKNARWEGFTPKQAQSWLSAMWAKARAKLGKISVMVYGVRVAEPHHDGTPHWHIMLFGTRFDLNMAAKVIRGYWFSDYRHELKSREARRARMDVKAVWPKRKADGTYTSAAGYMAKYIAKNIDGFKVGLDYETQGQDASKSCDRVAAWASAHRIRQFQQIGGPPVGLWRELRRLRSEVVDNPPVEAARKQASDESSWAGFVKAVGGIRVGRRGTVQLTKEHSGELSQYGELKSAEIVGVQSVCGSVRTREKVWRIERKQIQGHRGINLEACASRMSKGLGAPLSVSSMTGVAQPRAQAEGKGSALATLSQMDAGSTPVRRSPSYLGPVSITVRGDESRNRGEVKPQWPPTQ